MAAKLPGEYATLIAIQCRLGQIAREFKRLNDFMESGGEDES